MITSGIINLNKPPGITSHGCVQAVRRITGIKRVGHTGTLDPEAVGVLPVCIGGAARIMEYLEIDYKKYRCEMVLGLVTDTQDVWGETIRDLRKEIRSGACISSNAIEDVLASFEGANEQYPPKYSAVRVGGKRLYEYARAGEDVEIKKRKVFIKDISVAEVNPDEQKISFEITCSKGTYVRTVCHDAGEKLGCGGAMSGLTRLASGAFKIEDAVRLDDLAEKSEDEIERLILPADYPLVHFGRAVIVSREACGRFLNGGSVDLSETVVEATPEYAEKEPDFAIREEYRRAYNVYDGGGNVFLGVAFLNGNGVFAVDKVFFRRIV